MSRRTTELAVTIWGAITFGALLASFTASRPVRDALVLESDPKHIPWLFTASFVVFIVIAPLWGMAVRKNPRGVVPLSFHVFAGCALGFFWLVRAEVAPSVVGHAFYVWSAVFNLFVVSVFWSLLSDLLGPTTARRLYGPISAGGTIGAIGGPMLTKLLLGDIGVAGVLVITGLFLELAVIGAAQIKRIGAQLGPECAGDVPLEEGALNGLAHVRRSPYLMAMAAFVLCTAIAATFVYLAQADIVRHALPDRQARTDYFASIDLWTQLATLGIQLVLAGPLLRWIGPGLVLCVLPLAQGAGMFALVATPTLATLVLVQTISRTAQHGLLRPTRELLFTVVSRDEKYRAKNVIDTLIYRAGDFGSAWLYVGLTTVHAAGVAITLTAIPLTIGWLALAVILGVGFRQRVRLTRESS